MMTKAERMATLAALPEVVLTHLEKDRIMHQAALKNPFFIPEFTQRALNAILDWHSDSTLNAWLVNVEEVLQPKKVGLLLAGNIPLVGWHDLLTTFASGHFVYYKPSQKDEVLIDWLIQCLATISPKAQSYFTKVERLNGIEALVATGSTSTVSHFNYYFRSIPRLVRGSKSSIGVVYGFENERELEALTDDIMLYFGLGCRNVTKILVPEGYDFNHFFSALEKYRFLTDHHHYANNCIYHKAIFLMNQDPFLDNDILMLRQNPILYSPVGVLNYEYYSSIDHARQLIENQKNDVQCLVSHKGQFEGSIPFGTAQNPAIDDYADGINTLDFLRGL